MLKAVHTNQFTRVSSRGVTKGKRLTIDTYQVSGTSKEMAAYNAAQEADATAAGRDAAKDEHGNCLFFRVRNPLAGILREPTLNLKITFNGHAIVDNQDVTYQQEKDLFNEKQRNIARIAAEIEMGVTSRGEWSAPSTQIVEKPSVAQANDLLKEVETLQTQEAAAPLETLAD